MSSSPSRGGSHPPVTSSGRTDEGKNHVQAEYRGTVADQADMSALGRDQVLRLDLVAL
ncbi:uncharacterized protein ASPGLDRAFT_47410 [Aspergillus glaucus CBS 516.65]|uniref:Uncharacterized protein n=1 Tax=Aspergillus glaucus CBS 516.65 TaxID=1160497 RepID=A0A1L9VIJ1_ASPGL|nr:hypothetical protein ASPGLDRAFT_47410 [Aspergillus glaucus CBS 516.65]OJJ83736.1 hypothetical protein ASPGLDRAFT_47410 [Aspergillus glaucus CBS 516.65]